MIRLKPCRELHYHNRVGLGVRSIRLMQVIMRTCYSSYSILVLDGVDDAAPAEPTSVENGGAVSWEWGLRELS